MPKTTIREAILSGLAITVLFALLALAIITGVAIPTTP